jgi:hypothetical protein
MPLTGKSSSPSAKNRTLREAFTECRSSTRGRVNAVGAVRLFKKKISSLSATLGEEFYFFKKNSSPRVALGEEIVFLKKILFPGALEEDIPSALEMLQ